MIFAKINFTRCKLVTIINQQFQWWLDFLILDFIWWVSTFQDIDNVTEKPSPYSVLLPVCCEGWCPGPRSLSLSNTTETPRPVLLEKGFMGLTWTIEQLKITDNDNVSTSYVFYFFCCRFAPCLIWLSALRTNIRVDRGLSIWAYC